MLSENIKFCKKCLYSNKHPFGITFDENGICSGCQIHEEKNTLESHKSSNNIIAVGGGTFLNDKIRKQITNNCICIWLNWSEQILIPRIKNSKKRPKAYLLKDKDLKKLINDRSKIYSKADYKINCDSLGKNEIISKILKIYEK